MDISQKVRVSLYSSKKINASRTNKVVIDNKTYQFDAIFSPSSSESEKYAFVEQGVFSIALGYSCTILITDSETQPDYITPSLSTIFRSIEESSYTVFCSILDYQNDELKDCLAEEPSKLVVHERIDKGTYIENLTEVIVNTPEQCKELLLDKCIFFLRVEADTINASKKFTSGKLVIWNSFDFNIEFAKNPFLKSVIGGKSYTYIVNTSISKESMQCASNFRLMNIKPTKHEWNPISDKYVCALQLDHYKLKWNSYFKSSQGFNNLIDEMQRIRDSKTVIKNLSLKSVLKLKNTNNKLKLSSQSPKDRDFKLNDSAHKMYTPSPTNRRRRNANTADLLKKNKMQIKQNERKMKVLEDIETSHIFKLRREVGELETDIKEMEIHRIKHFPSQKIRKVIGKTFNEANTMKPLQSLLSFKKKNKKKPMIRRIEEFADVLLNKSFR